MYFAPGFEAEAAGVGRGDRCAHRCPHRAPHHPPGPIAGASVVVVLGTDLASVTPTTAAGGSTSTTAAN
jgi:hypothetical protein